MSLPESTLPETFPDNPRNFEKPAPHAFQRRFREITKAGRPAGRLPAEPTCVSCGCGPLTSWHSYTTEDVAYYMDYIRNLIAASGSCMTWAGPTEPPAPGADKLPFASGGIRSHKAPRFDLIPRAMMECLADRLELGLARKGEREILQRYKRGTQAEKDAILDDEGWWTEMRNHLQDHLIYLRDADYGDEGLWGHAGAAMWNAGMLAWRERELEKRSAADPERNA